MVFDTWVQCTARFGGLGRCPRTYHCKDRAARVAKSHAGAALGAFRAFVTQPKNDKFEFRRVHTLDPETGAQESYQVVMSDGRPCLRRTAHYGEDATRHEDTPVPRTLDDARVYDEAMRLALAWQACEDRLDAARYAAHATHAAQAQKKEGKQCR